MPFISALKNVFALFKRNIDCKSTDRAFHPKKKILFVQKNLCRLFHKLQFYDMKGSVNVLLDVEFNINDVNNFWILTFRPTAI